MVEDMSEAKRVLLTGNEAIAEAAIRAACRHLFGYPITPQNKIPEYMSKRLPEVGGVYLQAESEVAAINMLFGAAGAGARVMTSSSSPGISCARAVANMVMLGAYNTSRRVVHSDSLLEALRHTLGGGKEKIYELNKTAYNIGEKIGVE